jgi:hypothetical protein
MPPRYKFVEVSPVTDQTLEAAVNEWVAQGWHLEAIRFVVTEHSTRPRLAFVSFVDESVATAPPLPPRVHPLGPPDEAARVITAPQGDDVE